MLRAVSAGWGLLSVLAPGRILDAAESLAFENPEMGHPRGWTLPAARLEGLALIALAVRGSFPAPLRAPVALIGFMFAAIPRQMLSYCLELTYENPDELEVKSWVIPAMRVVGVIYVVVALFVGTVDAPEDAEVGS